MLPDCYAYLRPEPDSVHLKAIKHLYRLLAKMRVPDCYLHDLYWLKANLGRDNSQHPEYWKARVILNFLVP